MITFDLQRFGKGGGKSGGKIILTILGFALGGLPGAIMGAVLGSLIWGNKNKQNDNSSSIIRFDKYQETMTSGGSIPIIYGERRISGNQTYHETSADANTLHKHVVICEGEIEGITGISANGLLVPTGGQTSATVMTIQNTKWQDACLTYSNGHLGFHWNGAKRAKVWFPSKEDIQTSDNTYWEYQVSISALISYINRLGEGWEAFPTATTSNVPSEMRMVPHRSETRTLNYANWSGLSPYHKAKLNNGESVTVGGKRYVPLTYEEARSQCGAGFQWNGRVAFFIGLVGAFIWVIETHEDTNCYLNPIGFECNTVRGGTTYTFHDGDLPSNFEQVGSYAHMAWLDMTFVVSNELNGNPSVEAVVRGRKIYDTRTGQVAYSTNPAMCLRDFMLSERYGLGRWIDASDLDEQSFIDAANYCDELIQFSRSDGSSVTKKRFELNMVIDQKQSAWDWIDAMLGSFQAFLAINQGKIYLYIEKPSPIVYKFDESNIFDLKVTSTPLEDTPNQYKIKFVDPKNNWKTVTAEVNDYADQKDRGKIVIKEVELEGVTSQDQALRLGRFYRDYNFISSFNVTFKTGFQAMSLSCGDVICVTYKKVFVEMPFRIIEMKETSSHEFELTCRPYNESIYNDNLGANLIAYNYSQMKPLIGNPTRPENVEARQDCYVDDHGGNHNTVTVTWKASVYSKPVVYRVYVSGGNEWIFIAETPECKHVLSLSQADMLIGNQYQFGVYAVCGDKKSEYAFSDWITITDADEPPSTVKNLSAYLDGQIRISWEAPDDPDVNHYEVTVNGRTITTTNTFTMCDAIDGANQIEVVVVDNAGNKSEKSKTSVYADLAPSPVRNFQAKNQGGYIILTWDLSSNATSYMIEGSTNTTVYGNTYFMPATATGTFSYSIRALNEYGVSSPITATVDVTDTNTVSPMMEVNLFDLTDTYENAEARSEYKFRDFDCKMKDMTETGSRYGMYIVKTNC